MSPKLGLSEMGRARSITAELEQVLWYADGPQVVLLRIANKSFVLGVAIDRLSQDGSFFGSRIGPTQLDAYLRNRCDLRYVLTYPERQKHYLFDLPIENKRIPLRTFNFNAKKHENFLPDHRIFASDHTEEYVLHGTPFSFTQRYLVDGKWDVGEFSKFHKNLSDLYALNRSLESFEDSALAVEKRRAIVESFMKPWRGGGSYLSFFKEITKSGGRANRPEVDAIQWASPGYISVLGDQRSFEKVTALLRNYNENKNKIDTGYDDLWNFLRENKLLKTRRGNFDRKSPLAITVNERAKVFASMIKLTSFRTLKSLSGNDPLVAAKVLLASVRRISKMHQFFLEGRVQIEDADIG